MTTLTVSRLTGRPVAPNSRIAAVQAAAPATSTGRIEVKQPPLGQIIRPQVRDRWSARVLGQYTPQQVESIIRSAVSGNLVAQWEMFDLMEATWPRLSKNLNDLKDSAIGYLDTLQPWAKKGQKPTASAVQRADLIEEVLWNMEPNIAADENDFEDTLRDLLDARGKGIAVIEIDYHVREASGIGQVFAPRATRWIHPRYYGYPSGNNAPERLMLNLRELRNSGGNSTSPTLPEGFDFGPEYDGFVDFPAGKFLIGICKAKSGHPLGSSLLRLLGPFWAGFNFTWDSFMEFAQVFGQPIRWATFDPNISTTDRDTLSEMLEDMGRSAWGMFPAGTQLELKEAMKSGTDNPQMALLNFADKLCDILILRQTLTTDVGDSGSRALGDVHERKEAGVEVCVAEWASKNIRRQMIVPLCLANYGDRMECPWFMAEPEEETDPKATAEFVEAANRVVDLPRTWAYETLGVPQPAEGDEVIPAKSGGMQPAAGDGGLFPAVGKLRTPHSALRIEARDATDKVIDAALEELTGVQAKWLAGVKPFFHDLLVKARSEEVTDAEFVQALEAARKQFPELFDRLDTEELADALERAMGAAVVNGAVRGAMKRRRF